MQTGTNALALEWVFTPALTANTSLSVLCFSFGLMQPSTKGVLGNIKRASNQHSCNVQRLQRCGSLVLKRRIINRQDYCFHWTEEFLMLKRVYGKLRHLVESLIAILLLSFQQIPVVFTGTWPMLFPLAAYLTSMLWVDGKVFPLQIQILLFEQRLMPGRAITVIGFILFLIALFQFVKQRGQLISSGFYSIVRHPQYFSLIVMAFGISAMAREFGSAGRLPEGWSNLLAFFPWLTLLLESFPWLILVSGYVLLALFEEWRLTKEHEQYRQYKKEVPLLFPVPHKSRIEEAILSVTIILVMQFILMLPL